MEAREILKKYENYVDHWAEQEYSEDGIIQAMEQYSQHQAEERYLKAKKMLNNPDSNTLPLNMVLDAIWLAAYGGCLFCKSGTIQQVGNMYACEHCRTNVK